MIRLWQAKCSSCLYTKERRGKELELDQLVEKSSISYTHCASANPNRALRHGARVLVHGVTDRHHRPVHDPSPRVRNDDGVHAGAGSAVALLDNAWEPHRLRGHVRLHLLLRQLRAEQHDVHRAGGGLPCAAEVDMPRDIGSDREDGGDRGGLRVPVPGAEPGPSEGGPRLPCRDRGEECPLLACRVQSSGASVHLPGAGVEGKVAGGNDR
ncbi:hypothetical protein ZIOFF_037400 [Zingiber officinale]|uniref:Uncharacterized protein n=1 Tax=Zingiber officinale TaxID=94328 RepID=A0A8J5GS16_ZINOF|nr:hypothetical protein ZIOFF_037400 [Zingiber officinale]